MTATSYLDFQPARWLRNTHLQSVLSSAQPRRGRVWRQATAMLKQSRDMAIDCGDGVRLLGHYTPAGGNDNGRLAVLIHGWEGSGNSVYNLSLAAKLHAEGFALMRLNLRDHGNSCHLNQELFHSCRLAEVVGAVKWLTLAFADRRVALIGYSLGGNFALRVALHAPQAAIPLDRIVAVCPVLNPAQTMAALDRGWFVYRQYFINKWRRSLERKRQAFPDVYDFSHLTRFASLTAMTDYFVTRYTEYTELSTYLNGYALTGDYLEALQVPATMLLADDDPVIPIAGLENIARPTSLTVHRTRSGGHCGFLRDLDAGSWLDDYIAERLRD